MSKDVYETEQRAAPTPSIQMTITNAALSFLTAHTSATVSSPSSEYAYDKIINAGGGLYFRIQIGSEDPPASAWVKRGRMVNGEWVDDDIQSVTNLGPSSFYSGYAVLISINGGDVWDLGLYYVLSSSYGGAQWEVHIRCEKIKSSLTSDVYYAGCVYTGDPSGFRFPSTKEAVIVTNTPVRPYVLTNNHAKRNLPPRKFLLYPSLITFPIPCMLGAPTIGNQKVYYPSMEMETYMERIIDDATYISLGSVSIRST